MKKQLLFLFASALCTGNYAQAQQTIPNPSFENWTNGYINQPASWMSSDAKSDSAAPMTCQRGTPGAVGTSYVKLTVKNMSLYGFNFVLPAFIESEPDNSPTCKSSA